MSNRPMPVKTCLLTLALLFGACMIAAAAPKADVPQKFYFVQLSDTHIGFSDTNINPDYAGTLKKGIDEINGLKTQPDFIVFTGDLTHTTDNPLERRKRLMEFKAIAAGLKVTNVYFLPGEHDAALDNGAIYKEIFGQTYYAFDHKGVHFVAIDNVSDPTGKIDDVQLKWLGDTLKNFDKNSQVVILTHRPLFDLYPKWDWWTVNASNAIALLKPFQHVTVFYGHIHQNNTNTAGGIGQFAGKGMMYPLPAPGSVPKKAPVRWDAGKPYNNLGFREVEVDLSKPNNVITEYPITAAVDAGQTDNVIKITAKKFTFTPNVIRLKVGVPVTLEFTTLDSTHGFAVPDMKINVKIEPGKTSSVRIVPDKKGQFDFMCSVFCGTGHEDMTGTVIVE